jgi:hypothetical protein
MVDHKRAVCDNIRLQNKQAGCRMSGVIHSAKSRQLSGAAFPVCVLAGAVSLRCCLAYRGKQLRLGHMARSIVKHCLNKDVSS